MPDYSKSKIYKLICDDPELVYYGSTTQKYLSSRLCEHKKKNFRLSKRKSRMLYL